jgi:hypothetical protein
VSADIVARLRSEIAWEPEVGELLSQAAAHIESLRREVRTQRLEIAGLREERRAILGADDPPSPRNDNPGGGWIA